MSATIIHWKVCATVNDSDHLPEGVGCDDVTAEITEVLEGAMKTWYEQRGRELLACAPFIV
ncbi:hypothetical protein ACQP1V_43280 (plasmid) [Microtetraspora malaysiensis]|uniref:hypothetical protein n=1 Tax=Microtetraspora malaysiensis TaxID=161358 RepID=UPI003D913BB8